MDARRNEWREKDGDRSVARESGLKRCNDAKPSSLSRPGLAWRTNCSLARSLACPRVHTYVSNTQRVVLHVRALMETEDHARERFVSRPETSSRASAYLHACHYYLLKQTRACVCVSRTRDLDVRVDASMHTVVGDLDRITFDLHTTFEQVSAYFHVKIDPSNASCATSDLSWRPLLASFHDALVWNTFFFRCLT